MKYRIQELINGAEVKIRKLGYKESTIDYFKIGWRAALRSCEELKITDYGHEEESLVLGHLELDTTNRLTRHQMVMLRSIRCLLTLAEGNGMPGKLNPHAADVPGVFSGCFKAYCSHLRENGYSHFTLRNRFSIIRKFLSRVEVNSIEDIRWEDVQRYIERHLSPLRAQSKAQHLYVLRLFFHWMADEEIGDPTLADAMPTIPSHARAELPSAYSEEEISAVLSAYPSGECPKRDYAILLLGALCGMRVGDIQMLKVGDLDLSRGLIRFKQNKTGEANCIPLPKEAMYAIADYMQTERPEYEDDHIFLSTRAPIRPLDSMQCNFHGIPTKALAAASIDYRGRHHGMHALRHSAASCMLKDETPYPVISSVLGHKSTNTTRKYLSIDIEQLRRICLEVPHGKRIY